MHPCRCIRQHWPIPDGNSGNEPAFGRLGAFRKTPACIRGYRGSSPRGRCGEGQHRACPSQREIDPRGRPPRSACSELEQVLGEGDWPWKPRIERPDSRRYRRSGDRAVSNHANLKAVSQSEFEAREHAVQTLTRGSGHDSSRRLRDPRPRIDGRWKHGALLNASGANIDGGGA